MKLLLKSATILDKTSANNNQKLDILIENGIIKKIGKDISTKADKVIFQENLHVSRGWFDSSVSFGEPGFEERETIANGLDTAAKSGFTNIALNPNTFPIIDNNGAITSVKSKAAHHPVKMYPTGALTIKSEGVDLAELYDMKQGGAIAFGDYKRAVKNPNLLKIALQYAQNFNGLVQSFPQEDRIAGKGMVNEEQNSTSLGLKGIPNLAEELQITRDLYLLEYAGGKLHIPTISTKKSVSLIKEAKKKGLDVSCSVAIHNLIFTDALLQDFDTNTKVLPPLRTKEDIKALIKGLKDGTIDMITSDHTPIDTEHKKVEFDNALYGSIGLESAFGALSTIFSTEEVAEMLSKGKQRFGLEDIEIKEGNPADLSLFIPNKNYEFTEAHIFSTSKNSIFKGHQLKGKAFGIITKAGDFGL
ncbi:dihydroorotase [Salegentibacter salinarum]|uniref:Dihydroorotase n=1 Tax=Salegentibacter salinarum TaxID=447422 RepID=A0A2N0TQN4_9FLAO|nr:dihydroorotase [Salegentibacter salinarum]PKD17052.1 dihydroorotase [Salegentibacter salinarum]SKB54323.1 dihydroorotase [Salegentibacter salinarum]